MLSHCKLSETYSPKERDIFSQRHFTKTGIIMLEKLFWFSGFFSGIRLKTSYHSMLYLTNRTVSLQKDSSQLGPGTTSAHRGKRWCGRVTLSVKWNSSPAAVTRVSSRITQEEVKSGVNLQQNHRNHRMLRDGRDLSG